MMVDYLALIIPYIPGILVGSIPFIIWIGSRVYPSKEEQTNEVSLVLNELKELKDTYKKEYKEIKDKFDESLKVIENQNETIKELRDLLHEMQVQIGTLTTEVENLKSCKKRYYSLLDWTNDVLGIGRRKGFIDKLPLLPSKVNSDLEKR